MSHEKSITFQCAATFFLIYLVFASWRGIHFFLVIVGVKWIRFADIPIKLKLAGAFHLFAFYVETSAIAKIHSTWIPFVSNFIQNFILAKSVDVRHCCRRRRHQHSVRTELWHLVKHPKTSGKDWSTGKL